MSLEVDISNKRRQLQLSDLFEHSKRKRHSSRNRSQNKILSPENSTINSSAILIDTPSKTDSKSFIGLSSKSKKSFRFMNMLASLLAIMFIILNILNSNEQASINSQLRSELESLQQDLVNQRAMTLTLEQDLMMKDQNNIIINKQLEILQSSLDEQKSNISFLLSEKTMFLQIIDTKTIAEMELRTQIKTFQNDSNLLKLQIFICQNETNVLKQTMIEDKQEFVYFKHQIDKLQNDNDVIKQNIVQCNINLNDCQKTINFFKNIIAK